MHSISNGCHFEKQCNRAAFKWPDAIEVHSNGGHFEMHDLAQ
jgi:hypothetical protein